MVQGAANPKSRLKPKIVRPLLAGLIAAGFVLVADLVGFLVSTPGAFAALHPSSLAASAGVTILLGLLAGFAIFIGGRFAAAKGPAAAWSVSPLARAAQTGPGFVAALLLAAVPIALAVPVRARLLPGSPRLTALVDLVALVLALGMVRLGTRAAARWPRPLRATTLGITLSVLALGAAAVAISARPYLVSRGLLEGVLLAVACLAGASTLLLARPPTRALVLRRLAVAGWVGLGILTLVAIDRSERARGLAVTEIRPARWVVVDAGQKVDLDGDGFSPIFGGGDCNDLRASVHPDAIQIPGNGIDENCSGYDRRVAFPFPRRPVSSPLPSTVPAPSLVILITIDSLRADRLGAYGSRRNVTPNLDALTKESVVFQRAYTGAPTTRLAIPMLVTGRYLPEIRWNKNLHPWGVAQENVTIGETFRAAGWKTAAFVTAWMFKREWGYVQGFQHIDTRFAYGFGRGKVYTSVTSPQIVEAALRWIGRNRREKIFAWMHLFDPHISYTPHEGIPNFGEGSIGLYDGEVFFTDRALGTLFARLRALGLEDRTAIVVMADHGEMLGEHGQTVHNTVVWEEAARIPLLFRVPGVRPRRVRSVTSHIDVTPTLLDLARIDRGREQLSGASLVPELLGMEDAGREIVTEVRYPSAMRALVGPRYKLTENMRTGTVALYDLSQDPGEIRDVASDHAAIAQRMRSKLKAWHAHFAGVEMEKALADVLVDRLPREADRLDIRFANGIELVGVDLGKRLATADDTNLRTRFFLRATRNIQSDCRVRVQFYLKGRPGALKGCGEHVPGGGLVPFTLFPRNALVEDTITLRYKGGTGDAEGRLAIVCNRRAVRPRAGPNVLRDGRVDIGKVRIQRDSPRRVRTKR